MRTPFIIPVFFCLIFFSYSNFSWGQEPSQHYKIYSTKAGKEVRLQEIIDQMRAADVLLFGEEHNDSIAHYLQSKILIMMCQAYPRQITLSLEMFDRDVQSVMDEYLRGDIREKHFIKDARAWNNYKDYRPLVEFARLNAVDVICANAPTRYTNLAGRKGQEALNSLPKETKKFFAPIPYDTAKGLYLEKLNSLTGHTTDTSKKGMPVMQMQGFNMALSQSLWDATMAFSITQYLKKNKSKKILQINGRFHSDEGFAVAEQLSTYKKGIRKIIISAGVAPDFSNPDWKQYEKLGDFIILTDPEVSKTF